MTTESIIKTDGTEDYTTLTSWLSAIKSDYDNAPHIAYLWPENHAGLVLDRVVDSSLFTPDATHYISIQAHPDYPFKGKRIGTYPIINTVATGKNCGIHICNMAYTRIGGIFFNLSGGNTRVGIDIPHFYRASPPLNSLENNILIEKCGFDIQASGTSPRARGVSFVGGSGSMGIIGGTVRNCVFIRVMATKTVSDKDNSCEIAGIICMGTYGIDSLRVYNCLFNQITGVDTGSSDSRKANCLYVGTTGNGGSAPLYCYNTHFQTPTGTTDGTPWVSSNLQTIALSGTWNGTNNGYQASSALYGTSNQLSVVLENEILNTSTTAFNAHLSGISSQLRDTGADISGLTNAPTTDIDGEAW